MVFREGTVVQIRTVMNEMEKTLSLNSVEKSVANSKSNSPDKEKTPSFSSALESSRCCMGNHLFKSVFKCRFKKVKLLLGKGFNVNSKNDYGYNVLVAALHIDSDVHRVKMFKFLLDRGANPLEKDPKYGRSILAWACLLGRHDEVLMILQRFKAEFDLQEKDKDGMTSLHHATQGGHADVVRAIAQEFRRFRLSVDIPDKLGLSPYLHARRLGFTEIAEILREEGKACPAQSDMFTFRSSKEWSDLGVKERQERETKQRLSNYNLAAISGRSRLIQLFQNPFGSDISLHSAPSITVTDTQGNNRDIFDETSSPLQKNIAPSFRSISEPTYSDSYQGKLHRGIPGGMALPRTTMSLLDMTTKGRTVQSFKQSQLDTSKIQDDKHQMSTNITAMMDVLSEQASGSFRPNVRMKTPEPEVVIAAPKKRSTLAILFGKERKHRKKTKTGSATSTRKRPKGILKKK